MDYKERLKITVVNFLVLGWTKKIAEKKTKKKKTKKKP